MPVYSKENQPESELHKLLLRAVPANEHGNKSIANLADLIPCRRWSVNKWIIAGKLSPDKAMRVVEIGKMGEPEDADGCVVGRVKIEEFHPFVYKP